MIKPITNQEINQSKVASLPARPNASTAFGGAGYTSAQLKQAFDRLPLLLAERYNALVEAIFASDQKSLSAHIPTGITGPEGENYSLYDLLRHIEDGTFATYLKVGEKDLDLALKTLAPLDSPAFSGSPTATTPALSDASGRIATTEWVKRLYTQIFEVFEAIKKGLYGNLPEGGKEDDVLVKTSEGKHEVGWTSLKNYAFDAPTATTQAPEDNSTKIATTAFVQAAIAALKEVVDSLEGGSFEGDGGSYITVDQTYSPESENPQSGKAVAEMAEILEAIANHGVETSMSYINTKIQNLLRNVTQEPGESKSLIMSQKAVTDLVADALSGGETELETVSSVEEMTDTTKQYVLASTGTVWAYTTKEVYVEHNAYDADTAVFNTRLNGSGEEQAFNGAVVMGGYIDQAYDENCIVTFDGFESLSSIWGTGETIVCLGIAYYDSNKNFLGIVYNGSFGKTEWADLASPISFSAFKPTDKPTAAQNAVYVKVFVCLKYQESISAVDCEGLTINFSTKNGYQKVSAWEDSGLTPEASRANYVKLLVKVNENTSNISEIDRRVADIESGSGSLTIPSYWEEMIAEKTEAVKALQSAGGKDCVCFAWAADTHIPDNNGGWTNSLGKLMAKMLDSCEIPFAVLSGDIGTQASFSTEAKLVETHEQLPQHLAPLWGTERLLVALGNHDGVWGEGSATNLSGYYSQRFPKERMWQLYFRGQALDFRREFSDNGLYFYVDNKAQKTRFIVLNSHFAADYTEGRNIHDTSCYGQAQLDWLTDVALDMPTGYGAVIVAHVPPKLIHDETKVYTVDYEMLKGIINAYNNKATYSGSYTGVEGWTSGTVNVNFSGAKGEIIAMFAGHIHEDTVDITTLSCPLITVVSAGSTVYKDTLTRTQNTDTETSFDVVIINRATRTIKCVRVGAGADRIISY